MEGRKVRDRRLHARPATRFSGLMLALIVVLLLAGAAQQVNAYYMLETFDGNVWGSDWNLGYIDKNYSGGPNVAPNGSGNPWFGAGYNLSAIAGQRNGTNSARSATAVWMQNEMNIAYRFNGGNAFTQNIYVDYWYYNNATSNKQNLLDHLSLMYYSGLPTNTDYPTPLSLGTCSCDVWYGAPGYKRTSDSTWWWNYNAGTVNSGGTSSTATGNGWVVGWTNLRIVIGAKSGSTCPISFYQNGNLVATVNSIANPSFNMIMLTSYKNTMWSATYDDIKFGGMPANPVAVAATPDVNAITWNWTMSKSNQDSFKVYTASSGGSVVGNPTGNPPANNFRETGLASNTPYSRWVSAIDLVFETGRTALPATYTLADAPTPDVNVATTADNVTVYNRAAWPGFTNPQGFGTNGKVSKFKFKWSTDSDDTLADGEGSDWSSGVLAATPTAGPAYLYLRSYNASNVSNPNVLKLGPFNFVEAHAVNTTNCTPEAGSVSPSSAHEPGDSVTVTATVNPGYEFKNWTTDSCGGSEVISTDSSYSFTMGSENLDLYANYITYPRVSLTACPSAGGSVNGPSYAAEGTEVTVTASPNSGYSFKNWTADGCGGDVIVSTDASYTFTIGSEDVPLYANFVPDTYEYRVNAESGNFSYNGYWNNSGSAVCNGLAAKYGPNPPGEWVGCTPSLGMPGALYEVFVKSVDFAGCNESQDIVTTCEASGAVPVAGDFAVNSTNKWQRAYVGCGNYNSVGIIKLDAGVDNPSVKWTYRSGTVDNGCNGNRWYIWGVKFVEYKRGDIYGLTLAAGTGGTATPSHAPDASGIAYYKAGDSCTVTATPQPGYLFIGWTDASNTVVSTERTYTFAFPAADLALTANFHRSGSVQASAHPSDAGSVQGAGDYLLNTNCTLTATPASLYKFDRWTSDEAGTALVSTQNPYTFVVTGDVTLYAQFSLKDATPPMISDITVTPQNVGSTGNCLKGELYVDANVADAESGVASVQISLDGGDYVTMPLKQDGTYEKTYTIDAGWANGAHSIKVKATDNCSNAATSDPAAFSVNKNQISGVIGLEGLISASISRDVTFALNGGTPRVVTLSFLNGVSHYTLLDVPDVTSISAKAAWNLRRLITAPYGTDGQYEADFVGTCVVLGGDLTGDNVINALDYSVLRGAWGTGGVGDITGDGYTDNADYLIMKANWYKKGDAQ